MIYEIINADPPQMPASLPDGISDIVLKCLAKMPEDRFQNSDELADALQPFLSPTQLRQASTSSMNATPSDTQPSFVKITTRFGLIATVVLGIVYKSEDRRVGEEVQTRLSPSP